MLPPFLQRVLMLLAVLVGGGVLWLMAGPLASDTGLGGLSLWQSSGVSGGPQWGWWAMCLLLLASVPGVCLAWVCSSAGHPLTGFFVLGASATCLAVAGGPGDDFFRHQADIGASVSGVYLGLMAEVFVWMLPAGVLMLAVIKWRKGVQRKLGWLHRPSALGDQLVWQMPNGSAILAGLLCCVVAGVLGLFLLQSASSKQVIVGLTLAFAVGSMVAHTALGQQNPIVILCSPLIVAVCAYGYAAMHYGDNMQMFLFDWYQGKLPGLAIALPMHYASAALAGVAMGIGWSQGLAHESEQKKLAAG